MFKQASQYFIANLISSLIGFVGLIVFTRLISPSDYGLYALHIAVVMLGFPFFFNWLRLSLVQNQSQNKDIDYSNVISAGFCFIIPVAFLIIFSVNSFIPQFHLSSIMLFLMVVIAGIYEVLLEKTRALQQVKTYSFMVIARGFGYLIFTFLFIYFYNADYNSLLFGFILALFSGLLVYLAMSKKTTINGFDKQLLLSWFKVAPKTTLIALLFAFMAVADRFIIGRFIDNNAVGQYVASNDFVRQILNAPSIAFAAIFMSRSIETFHNNHEKYEEQMKEGLVSIVTILMPTAFGLALVGADIAKILLGEKFSIVSHTIIPALAIGFLCQNLANSYFHAVFHAQKKYLPIILQLTMSLILYVVLMVLLLEKYGLKGAAFAFMCAEILNLIISFFMAQYYSGFSLFTVKLFKVVVINCFISLLVVFYLSLTPAGLWQVLGAILIYTSLYSCFLLRSKESFIAHKGG